MWSKCVIGSHFSPKTQLVKLVARVDLRRTEVSWQQSPRARCKKIGKSIMERAAGQGIKSFTTNVCLGLTLQRGKRVLIQTPSLPSAHALWPLISKHWLDLRVPLLTCLLGRQVSKACLEIHLPGVTLFMHHISHLQLSLQGVLVAWPIYKYKFTCPIQVLNYDDKLWTGSDGEPTLRETEIVCTWLF